MKINSLIANFTLRSPFVRLSLLSGFVATGSLSAQSTVFTEDFPNATGDTLGFADFGWTGFVQFSTVPGQIFTMNTTKDSDDASVSADPGSGGADGFADVTMDFGRTAQLFYTDTSSLGLDAADLAEFTIETNGYSQPWDVDLRASFYVDGAWYVTDKITTAHVADTWMDSSFDLETANWSTITGSDTWTGSDPSGQLTGFTSVAGLPNAQVEELGILIEGFDDYMGFDSVNVTAVPEPATWILPFFILCGVLNPGFRRRVRSTRQSRP